MPSKRVLYGISRSPPVRAVQLALAALELDYVLTPVDIYGDKTEEYLKKNPQHTIPALEEDDGKVLWDSHAIMAYLVRRYGKEYNSLYPKGYYERAVVDQRLHYENGVIFVGLCKQKLFPFLRGEGKKENLNDTIQSIHEVYDMLEVFLGDNNYMAGDSLTIADLSILTTVQTAAMMAKIESEKHSKLAAWFERMKQLPYYAAICEEPLKLLEERVNIALKDFN